jgi:hypothetical protein
MLPPNRSVAEMFDVYDELFRSEGIDPTWRGFDESEPAGT